MTKSEIIFVACDLSYRSRVAVDLRIASRPCCNNVLLPSYQERPKTFNYVIQHHKAELILPIYFHNEQ